MERSTALFRAWQAKLAGPETSFRTERESADSDGAVAGRQYRHEQERIDAVSAQGGTEEAAPELMQQEMPGTEQVRRRMRDVLADGLAGSRLSAAQGEQGVAGVYEGRPALAGGMAQVLVSGWQQDDAANGSAAMARQMQEAQERQSLLAMSDRFERDARRYDGGFLLY